MKQSGMGDNLYVAGYNLSGDIGSIDQIAAPMKPIEVTGIDKSGFERIGGARDGQLKYTAYFNPSAGQAHPRLASLPTTDQITTYCRGTTLGNPAAAMVAKQIGYDGKRGNDGSLTFTVEAQASGYGVEWGRQGTAGKRTDTGATNGTSIDDTAASLYGLQAYLHVFAFVGTDATVKLQESSDNGGADAFADVTGGAFTQVTSGPTSQRIATAADLAVERYLRVVTVTTGGFTSLQFAVMIVRNLAAVTF